MDFFLLSQISRNKSVTVLYWLMCAFIFLPLGLCCNLLGSGFKQVSCDCFRIWSDSCKSFNWPRSTLCYGGCVSPCAPENALLDVLDSVLQCSSQRWQVFSVLALSMWSALRLDKLCLFRTRNFPIYMMLLLRIIITHFRLFIGFNFLLMFYHPVFSILYFTVTLS